MAGPLTLPSTVWHDLFELCDTAELRAISMADSQLAGIAQPAFFLNAPINLAGLERRLGHEPGAVRVERLLRSQALFVLDGDRAACRLQLCLQHLRRSRPYPHVVKLAEAVRLMEDVTFPGCSEVAVSAILERDPVGARLVRLLSAHGQQDIGDQISELHKIWCDGMLRFSVCAVMKVLLELALISHRGPGFPRIAVRLELEAALSLGFPG